jgi:hypothetical protein
VAATLTATQIVTLAGQIAKTPGMTAQGGQFLNVILEELAQNYDFDLAKGTYNFTFPVATRAIGNLNASLASGPIFLPADYLRAKRGDIMWFNAGFPMQLVPIDLDEFDRLVQTPGLMSFPTIFATDMSQPQILLTQAGSNSGSTTLDNIPDTSSLYVGAVVVKTDVPMFTTITAIVNANTVTMSNAATNTFIGQTIFQQPPMAYVWPPASGAYPAMVRYSRQVPPLATPEASTYYPWFPDTQYLITALAGRLMQIAGDDRWEAFLSDNADLHPGGAGVQLRKYLVMKDDSSDRSKRITLDRRRFGLGVVNLPPSKILGAF